MKVVCRKPDAVATPALVELELTATGKPGDTDNLPDGLIALPYNGPWTVDWGDGSAWQVIPQPDDGGTPPVQTDEPTVVDHTYDQVGTFRIHVHGDARVTVHALAGQLAAVV